MSTDKMAPPLPEAVREQIISDFCAKGEHGWCMNRNFKETHCQCSCHAEAQRKRDLAEIERLKKKYPKEFAEAAAQQERHDNCHDLVCNGDRRFPRGESGHSCSCRGREERSTHHDRCVCGHPADAHGNDGTGACGATATCRAG